MAVLARLVRAVTVTLSASGFLIWVPVGAPVEARQIVACERLAELALPGTTITSVERVTNGSVTLPLPKAPTVTDLPPLCRVAGSIRPTIDSDIRFEAWLPLDNWNGKFAGVGNGGWAGQISYGGLSEQIRRGYAVVSTDTGHQGNGGDASFAHGHPEKLVDFAHRAIHETTVAGKALVRAHYGRPAERSYWVGCSSGGYQGLMLAQRYPDDYDGLAIGAPANNWTRLMAGDFDGVLAVLKDESTVLSQAATTILNQAVVAACDANDGAKDGVLEDPRTCAFDPASLTCGAGGPEGACLTPGQVTAARRVYAGLRDPATGAPLFPGLAKGSEPYWPHRNPANPFPIPVSHYRYLVFADPNWDWRTFEFTDPDDYKVHAAAEARLAPILNATNPDLTAFRTRGGRIVQYHGWNDQLIAAESSINYYESVVSHVAQGRARSVALADAQQFYRLYMVPGLAHCSGGNGVNTFDVQTAMEAWVERGVAPAALPATRTVKGVVERSRPLCVYPEVAVYDGRGNVTDAASFSCGPPAPAR